MCAESLEKTRVNLQAHYNLFVNTITASRGVDNFWIMGWLFPSHFHLRSAPLTFLSATRLSEVMHGPHVVGCQRVQEDVAKTHYLWALADSHLPSSLAKPKDTLLLCKMPLWRDSKATPINYAAAASPAFSEAPVSSVFVSSVAWPSSCFTSSPSMVMKFG